MYSVWGSSFIWERTSDSRIGSGLLSTMPKAPFSVCSQMRDTVWAKLGSDRDGIAISRWFVRLFCALSANGDVPIPGTPVTVMFLPPISRVWGSAAEGSRNGRHAATPSPLPFVDKTQHVMLARQFRWERIKRSGELQSLQRHIVQLARAAATADDIGDQRSIRGNTHLDHRIGFLLRQHSCRIRKVDGSDALDLVTPRIQVGRQRGGLGI